MTNFTDVYNRFLGKITDDMYMELTQEDTAAIAQDLLLTAVHKFEFPRKPLDYKLDYHTLEDEAGNEYTVGAINNGKNSWCPPDLQYPLRKPIQKYTFQNKINE